MLSIFSFPRFPRPCRKIDNSKKLVISKPPGVVAPQVLEKKVVQHLDITEFEVRVFFSTSILAFSMAMLITKRGDPGVYMPLITSVLGYWTPSPSKDKN